MNPTTTPKKPASAKRLAYQKKWRAEHKDELREYAAQYHLDNGDTIRARAKAWYEDNPEQARENHKLWRAANPEKKREHDRRRKALIRGASRSDFTDREFEILCEIFSHCCAYCGVYAPGKLTRDHIEPVIKGGPDTLWNIVPACGPCNSRKHAGPVPVTVQPLLLAVPASANPNAKKPRKKAS
jgi:5-methylcytosine-specific restriction endonuclease McrA